MFCPSCGVKNEGSPLKCFICGYILPTGERGAATDRRTRRSTVSSANAEPYAAIGDRMLALILDRVVIAALLLIPAALIATRLPAGSSLVQPVRAAIAISIAFVVAALAYHIVLEALFGATLGKGLLGLEVRNGSGERPWLTSTIRNLVRVVDASIFYVLAFVVALFTRRRQRIGDLVAGTTVIERRVAVGARIALLSIFVALVAGSIWLASSLCPSCLPDVSKFTIR